MKTVLTVLLCLLLAGVVLFWREKRSSAGATQLPASAAGPVATAPALAPAQRAPATPAMAAAPGKEAAPSLPAPPGATWEQAGAGPAFSRFAEWTHRYGAAATAGEKSALEAEGITLARARLDALAALIQADPKQALELAVPLGVRMGLPKSVEELLEERVSAKGDLMVVGVLALPGREAETRPVTRLASAGGKFYDAYTYGWRVEKNISSQNVPIIGIAAPTKSGKEVLAVSSEFVRLAEPEEAAAARAAVLGPICSISGLAADSRQQPTAVDVGGEFKFTCGVDHAVILNQRLIEAASAGSGSSGGGVQPLAAALDPYASGRKRFLLLRPIWTNYSTTMPTNTALTHFASFSNYMYQMSFGQMVFAGLGKGSDVTPEMLLPGDVATYDNTGLGLLFTASKNAAVTNYGYNLSQYDFIYVVTAGSPAASYAGLGYVRGVGFHLANSYWGAGTASHEFGHNLGYNHANFYNSDSRSAAGFGQSIEYGDSTDPMGGASGLPEHYGSRNKNYLGWVLDSDVAAVSGSATYRLYSLDVANVPGGLRGLRYARTGSQNYWVQFRQLYTSKPMTNGVQLLLTGNGNEHTHLLDVRLRNTATDDALVMGRTFSDTNLGLHITPIGKGHTYPESMDVVVNVGAFSTNLPPVASVSASTTSASVGQVITFNAAATDPNGDPLAYYWDFDDTDYSVDNSASTTHTFTSPGEYSVQCAVSDMKGKVARSSVLVRVGSPATFRISGRVLDPNNRPIGGLRVFVNSSTDALTDSDGRYTLTRLAAGNYTVDLNDPLIDNLYGLHPFFSNPVTIGPNFTDADFTAGVSTGFFPALVAKKSASWKYLDDGSDQGTGWTTNGFNDSSWKTGTGIFGFGGNTDATTTLGSGPDGNNKYRTYYFRKAFNVPNPGAYTQLLLETLRQTESGVIVYLNGTEILRENMPAGAVTYTTLGVNSVSTHVYRQALLSTNLLVAGTNIISAELHLTSAGTADTRFDLALGGEPLATAAKENITYLITPVNNQAFASGASVSLTAVANSGNGPVDFVSFYADGANLGNVTNPPYNFTWNSPPDGSHSLSVVGTAAGLLFTSAPISIQLVAPLAPPVSLSLIDSGSVWKYYATNAAPAGLWTSNLYNDNAWLSGPAKLGYGQGDEATTISYGTNPSSKWISSYYRQAFIANDPAGMTNLLVQLKRDDGAIVYLNGLEVFRDNMPAGAVSWGTLASAAAPDNGQTFVSFNIGPSNIAVGSNMLAVEIHQSVANTPDAAFDLSLTAQALTNRARSAWVTAPTNGATIRLPASVTISAQAVVGGNLSLGGMQFYVDGVKIGQDTTAPYSFAWPNPEGGPHEIVAVAVDSAHLNVTSPPVNITIIGPPASRALISFGDVWKYLDDGSNQGTNWATRTFNDGTWQSGPARLGYGGDGELTTISYGPDPTSRYITAYFRKAFTISSPSDYGSLLLRLIRDDGAVVYLNGVEIYRNNLQAGAVSWNSLATTTINAPDETTPVDVTLGTNGLRSGTNVLAVELHQASTNSSDAGFDLALIGQNNTNLTQGIYITSPEDATRIYAGTNLALSAFAQAPAGITAVDYYDGAAWLGQATAFPYNLTWTNPAAGTHLLTARATDGASQQTTSAVVSVSVSLRPAVLVPLTETLISAGASWRFWDSATAVSSGWQNTNFDDTVWPSGAARFGWGLDGEVTTLTSGRITHYFRRWFTVTNPLLLTQLTFQLQRDDGAVVYLNGTEVFRSNMPGGTVTASTLASSTVDTPNETTVFQTILPLGPTSLNTGSNLVTVELHQGSANSSDAGFDLALLDSGRTDERVVLVSPASSQVVTLPAAVPLAATAWGGYGVPISRLEFYADSVKVGEATNAPYQFSWFDAPAGLHSLTAVVTANNGLQATSPAVSMTVIYQPVSALLFPSNSVWKYLDDGTDQGTNWSRRDFDDSTWASAPARLGYPAPVDTLLSYGSDTTHKYPTYYFRRWFTVPSTMGVTNLALRLLRDDGAVVWLNGVEILRNNMPTNPITYGTFASTNVATVAQYFYNLVAPAPSILPGTNVLAVEVHQSFAASGDMYFDLELSGLGYVVAPPPSIVASAPNLLLNAGDTGSLPVSVSGAAPLVFQWWKDGVALTDGPRTSGSTTSNLTLSAVTSGDQGNYWVVVANSHGMATSAVSVLTLRVPPSITQFPSSQVTTQGQQVVLTVVAGGDAPLSYQWSKDGSPVADGPRISGSTSPSLTLNPVLGADQGSYRVTVSNLAGVATSGVDVVTVRIPPYVTQPPSSLAATQGQTVTLSVTAGGDAPLGYQWRFNGGALAGANGTSYLIASMQSGNAGDYDVVISNNSGSTTSAVAAVTLAAPPEITQPLADQRVFAGATAMFQVGASDSTSLSYRWYDNASNLLAVASNKLVLNSVTAAQAGLYRVEVRNTFGLMAASEANLIVLEVAAWGDGSNGKTNVPLNLTGVVAVSGGNSFSLALRNNGQVAMWGGDAHGQGSVLSNLNDVVAVAAGGEHTLVLRADGTVVVAGDSTYNQTNVPGGLAGVVGIGAGAYHSLALQSNGTAIGWGGGVFDLGQSTVPSDGLTNLVAVAGGGLHSLALRGDGHVFAWGDNTFNQTNLPDLSNVVDIAAGEAHSLALRVDGTVAAWGRNNRGQTSVPEGLSNVVLVAAGGDVSLALRADGQIIVWGDNSFGQSNNLPAGLSGATLAAGAQHCLAVAGNGLALGHVPAQVGWSNQVCSIRVPTLRGHRYALLFKNSLDETNWKLVSLQAGDGENHTFQDPAATGGQRFYRIGRW